MGNSKFKLTMKKWDLASADDRRKPTIEASIKKNGGLPNMYANMINSPGLLETYLYGYEVFRKESGFTPIEQEVVFLTISYENGCEYCMAAHSVIADKMSKVPEAVTNAIRDGNEIGDPKLKALSLFAKEMLLSRGRPSCEATKQFLDVGYDEGKILEIVLAIAVKTLSNYSNHLFETEVDPMFKGRSWKK
jgi:AhpD family alkylhydroperoxidase